MPAVMRNRDISGLAVTTGVPVYLGVLVATTNVDNTTTAAPFNSTGNQLKGKCLLIQPDAACYLYFGDTSAAAAATTTNGISVAAGERVVVWMTREKGLIACLSAAGTTNCRVWELT